MGEAIDLTLSDSEDEAPPPQRKPRARAAPAAAARDAERQQEEAARKRIMDFAKSKGSSKRLKAAEDDGGDDYAPMPPAADPQQETLAPAAPGAAPAAPAAPADAAAAPAAPADAAAAPAAGDLPSANAQLRELHEARMRRQQQQQQQAAAGGEAVQPGPASTAAAANAPAASGGSARLASQQRAPRQDAAAERGSRDISLLTYNVWFREDLAVLERMLAIGDIITNAGHPTFVCLQEVTPMILELFEQMPWWQQYKCCAPPALAPYFTLLLVNRAAAPAAGAASFKEEHFANSIMGRSLRSVRVEAAGHSLLVATSHLESPMPPHNWYSEPRQWQMRHSLEQLDAAGVGNVLFAGDMNWDEKRDGSPPLPPGWLDAWQALEVRNKQQRPGFTYDTKNNGMLAFKGLQLRLDRIFCKLADWRLKSVELLGTQALPGLQHTHRFRNGGTKQLPVLPSDHFGVLMRMEKAG